MSKWQTGLPEPGRKVLAFYRNSHGKGRIVNAMYVHEKEIESRPYSDDNDIGVYDEESDTYYWPAGWYECIENLDDYSCINVTEGKVTHWMPLPQPPSEIARP